MSTKKIIIALGNPGRKYLHTRHNIGEEFGKAFLQSKKFPGLKENKKLKALISKKENTMVVFPTVYMNESGETAQRVLSYYKEDAENMLVVHDDMDLPLGKIRLAKNSRSGGHNGVLSIIEKLGSSEFSRLKIGINPTDPELIKLRRLDPSGFVLGKFTEQEKEILHQILPLALEIAEKFSI